MVKAVAVQEPGRYAAANVIGFQYELLAKMTCIIENWVSCQNFKQLETELFERCFDADMRTELQKSLQKFATQLTRGQLCADWFLLQKFRITATVSEKILLKKPSVRKELQMLLSTDQV